jgi:hypothetical protein
LSPSSVTNLLVGSAAAVAAIGAAIVLILTGAIR